MSGPPFERVSSELDFPAEEAETLRFWKERGIFEKTLSKPAPNGNFVFYEGPPTANGLPHNGHVLTRVIKDLFPRYKTMRGWSVPRKAGWDTHGLPVEVEVEKELRLHGKAAIEAYGVEPFIKKCIESVFRYTREWESLTNRVAFWADLDDAYVTYHRSYVESVWWALGELFKKGLLYQGHKVVWWWAQGGTALSAGEVGQGYKTVDDPSVYVAFPVVGEANLALLVWTTTPWTLPSNMYAAVNASLDYVTVKLQDGRRFVVAKALLETLAKKLGCELAIEREMKGRDLVGLAYKPPFDLFAHGVAGFEDIVWHVIAADFVTLDAGTGIVHIAPAFGQDDHDVHRKIERGRPGFPLLCAVEPDGTFIARFERYAGRWVKDCDKEISHDLKDAGLLVHAEQYRHDYPFCWRADTDPLIQYARPAWYIRTTAHIDRAIENNSHIHWLPEHIKEGRFGDFLKNNVDWALSRERWWGTPLNVWVCDRDESHKSVPASIAEIERRNPRAFDHFHAARRADPSLSEHLIVHKPWIDQVTMPCEECAAAGGGSDGSADTTRSTGTMRRVTEVIDCWFDSGCMPFAQWGYPHATGSKERFEASFPADFISEAIDQTRGWFYSLLMVSTLVFEKAAYPHPFKTCIVLGHVTDKEGKKESKSKGNYTPPEIILDKVAMDFAVLGEPEPKKGVALIAREDLEGLDLQDGARVRVYRSDAPDRALDLVLRVAKKVRRRLVVLHEDDRAALGVLPTSTTDVMPVAVPRLPAEERVVIEDPSTPAPGADAFRWFFYASSPPWSATRHSLSNVRALQKEFAVKLRNVYSFFTIYANIDGFDPRRGEGGGADGGEHVEHVELDRWIRSELALTVRTVIERMDAYDGYGATQKLVAFVDALSNWYLRRTRKRFWRSGLDADKRAGYATLHHCLVTLAKLTAPFTPYAAEAMYQNLVVRARLDGARESVHLEDFPEAIADAIDAGLSNKIATVRALASLGLQVRNQAKIKVRQPLATTHVITTHLQELDASVNEQLAEELNTGETHFVPMENASQYVEFRLKPNFRSLGQRGLGKEAQLLKKTMGAMPSAKAGELASVLMAGQVTTLDGVELKREDVEIEFVAREGFAAAGDRVGVVVLDTRLDAALLDRGLVNEFVNRVQVARRELGLEYTDRIRVSILGSERVCAVVGSAREAIAGEVLALDVSPVEPVLGGYDREIDVDGEAIRLGVARVERSRGG
jgi:isoleucyl-tRNA synthetase